MTRHAGRLAPALAAALLAVPPVSSTAARAASGIVATCTVGGSAAPCSSGWYTADVTVSFSFSISGFHDPEGCGNQVVSSDTAGVSFRCTVVLDGSNEVVGTSVTIRRDATPPTATAISPDRPPDASGWYNHPVTFSTAGSDSLSGIASCTSLTYSGPDATAGTITGTCRDNAGNTSAQLSLSFQYDSTPPGLSDLAATPLDRGASLRWKAAADGVEVRITRAEGAAAPVTLYDGKPRTSFVDAKLRNGVGYLYEVTLLDRAGNATSGKILVRPSSPLLAPRLAAHVRGGTTLRWRPAKRAAYYNVQLWRKGKKVLTAWPAHPVYRIRPTWLYRGRTQRLDPGRYVWYVWPGYGPRAKHRYGPLIGKSTFVVTRGRRP